MGVGVGSGISKIHHDSSAYSAEAVPRLRYYINRYLLKFYWNNKRKHCIIRLSLFNLCLQHQGSGHDRCTEGKEWDLFNALFSGVRIRPSFCAWKHLYWPAAKGGGGCWIWIGGIPEAGPLLIVRLIQPQKEAEKATSSLHAHTMRGKIRYPHQGTCMDNQKYDSWETFLTFRLVTDGKTETQSRKESCSRSYNKLEQDRKNPIEVDTELEMGKKPSGGRPKFCEAWSL